MSGVYTVFYSYHAPKFKNPNIWLTKEVKAAGEKRGGRNRAV
jgi:hypothetical protein